MSNVEQALVTEVDWLLVKHLRRDHPERDEVPRLPKALPFVTGRRAIWVGGVGERREAEGCFLKDIDGSRREGKIVDEVKLGGGNRGQNVIARDLV